MHTRWHAPMDENDGDNQGGGGGSEAHWSEGLGFSEEVANSDFVKTHKDLPTFAKSALEAHKFAGASLRIPSEHASEEDREAFRTKLRERVPTLVEYDPAKPESVTSLRRAMGMPEEASGYQAPAVDVGEFAPPAYDEQVAFFREVAHRNGLTADQFQGVLKPMVERTAQARQAMAQERAGEMDALKKEWGDAAAQRFSAAKAAAQATNAPEALMEAIEADNVDAGVWRWLAQIHDQLGGKPSDGNRDGERGNTGEITPSEAAHLINEIYANKEHPFHNGANPRHAWAVEEVQRLNKIKMGPEGREQHGLDMVVEPEAGVGFSGKV